MTPHLRRALGAVLLLAGLAIAVLTGPFPGRLAVVAVLTIGGAFLLVAPTVTRPTGAAPPPVALGPVVRGRWTAVNSPTTKVPSHGTHAFAQTYAVDLLVEGDLTGAGGAFGPPDPMASFDQPVLSAVDGLVVTARDGQRDHRNRRGLLGSLYLFPESVVRSFALGTLVPGNHVVVRADPPVPGAADVHVLVCHLRRGSVRVRPGDRVRAGDELGRCGNSGNSSQPHVHVQAMDGPDPLRARGLPFVTASAAGPVPLPGTAQTAEF